MSETSHRFLRALRDLALALVNATLILIALCLFLALRLVDRVDGITETFAANLVSVDPLRRDVGQMTDEIAGLRADLAAVRTQTGELTSESARALAERLDAFEARLNEVRDRTDTVKSRIETAEFNPEAMLERAIETAVAEFTAQAGQLAGCVPTRAGGPAGTAPPAGDAGGQ